MSLELFTAQQHTTNITRIPFTLWLFSVRLLEMVFLKRILEKALGNIWPVIPFCIFPSKLSKFLVHFPVEVVSEEEGPETKKGVHFLWLSNT